MVPNDNLWCFRGQVKSYFLTYEFYLNFYSENANECIERIAFDRKKLRNLGSHKSHAMFWKLVSQHQLNCQLNEAWIQEVCQFASHWVNSINQNHRNLKIFPARILEHWHNQNKLSSINDIINRHVKFIPMRNYEL